MSKPFDKDLAKKAEEETKELVKVLNNTLKKYEASFGPQKDHDIEIKCKNNKEIIIYVAGRIDVNYHALTDGDFHPLKPPDKVY